MATLFNDPTVAEIEAKLGYPAGHIKDVDGTPADPTMKFAELRKRFERMLSGPPVRMSQEMRDKAEELHARAKSIRLLNKLGDLTAESEQEKRRPRPPRFTIKSVGVQQGIDEELEAAFKANPLGIVGYDVRNEGNVRILLSALNSYNQEVRQLRLEVVKITHNTDPLLDAIRNPGSYRGTWTVWMKCHDLRALINLGREVQSNIYDARR